MVITSIPDTDELPPRPELDEDAPRLYRLHGILMHKEEVYLLEYDDDFYIVTETGYSEIGSVTRFIKESDSAEAEISTLILSCVEIDTKKTDEIVAPEKLYGVLEDHPFANLIMTPYSFFIIIRRIQNPDYFIRGLPYFFGEIDNRFFYEQKENEETTLDSIVEAVRELVDMVQKNGSDLSGTRWREYSS